MQVLWLSLGKEQASYLHLLHCRATISSVLYGTPTAEKHQHTRECPEKSPQNVLQMLGPGLFPIAPIIFKIVHGLVNFPSGILILTQAVNLRLSLP